MSAESRLAELGWELPPMRAPLGRNVPHRLAGSTLYVGGCGALRTDGSFVIGKLGQELTAEEGYAAARLAGLSMLAKLRHALGSLDRVEQTLKVIGLVNALPSFTEYPKVINGFTDVLVDVFGDAGLSARMAYGVSGLALNMPVEVDGTFLVKP